MDKDELLNVVKNWISLDDQIKELQKRIREMKSEKKQATETLVETMKNNEIDCFELGAGNKLMYTKNKSKKPLSKKHLLESLSKYFQGNNEQVAQLSKFIMNSREETVRENIRRKIPKK
jgi:TolA-binding protein